ncbi:MAG: LysM peptidoglycan-binding domain-containing protein [Cellvibrionaceae bacterium]|nr:LysM peptidoglycan-binding domain-containing protein [Cellvibrionaceae bacterium]
MRKIYYLVVIMLSACYGLLACSAKQPQTHSSHHSDTQTATHSAINRQNTGPTPSATASAAEAEDAATQTATTDKTANLWVRIRNGFGFATEDYSGNAAIAQRIEKYSRRLQQSPALLQAVAANAKPYLYFIVDALEKHKIPLEVALLPIVESRYDPFAYSPGRAAGLWQFIPSTGKRFGLTQNWWQDERRDTLSATAAAIEYLHYLHRRFDNDWLLALAAYNAGQGTVAKAIRRNKQQGKASDYWSLNLPRETRDYIPKLLAWRALIDKADIPLAAIANQPYFAIVDIGSQIDLAEAAELADVDIDDIYQLNPAFNRWATDPEPPHQLLIPLAQKDIMAQNLAQTPAANRMSWRRYIIRPNDALIKIAKKFNTTPQLIARLNGLKSYRIKAGDALLIPSPAKPGDYYSQSIEQRLAKKQGRAGKPDRQRIEHQVTAGDTLWDLSRRYGVSVNAIARWNNMAPKDSLGIKQTLVIWTQKKGAAKGGDNNETRKLVYTVKAGDSLASIAQKFKVKIQDIRRWNKLQQQRYLQPGQRLRLYIALTDRILP